MEAAWTAPAEPFTEPTGPFPDLRTWLGGLRYGHEPRTRRRQRREALSLSTTALQPLQALHAVNESELETVVRAARGGDPGAQEALIVAYQKRLGGFVYGMVSDPAQVDDL